MMVLGSHPWRGADTACEQNLPPPQPLAPPGPFPALGTLRSMLSSQVSLVWEGLPGSGRRTMQVGPFSALGGERGPGQTQPWALSLKNALWDLGFPQQLLLPVQTQRL